MTTRYLCIGRTMLSRCPTVRLFVCRSHMFLHRTAIDIYQQETHE